MQYVYHGVPEEMKGNNLVPLNQMQTSHPELYKKYRQKYEGREAVMQKKIPLLNCLWNDVIQFMPVHPRKVFELQKKLGLITEVPPYKFFEIDISVFNIDKMVVYFKTAIGEQNVEVKWFRDVNLADIQEVPKATFDYYTSLVGTGELPFNYQFIPHVLYMGTVETSKLPIITI
ncbi:MAG TPA: hypothetical protein VIH90_01560 [Candidatus Saccharimonadales bacterium]